MTYFKNICKNISIGFVRRFYLSIATSFALGALAAVVPIPWVSIIYNKNYDNFFSIPTFKIVKNHMTSFSSKILDQLPGSKLKSNLTSCITNSAWIDKNITASFAVTKADTRDLVDISPHNDTENVSRYAISNIDVKYIDFEKEISEVTIKWISRYLIILNGRETYLNFLNGIKKEQEIERLESAKLLPSLSLDLGAVQSRLNKVIKIEGQNTSQPGSAVSIQFNLNRSPKDQDQDKDISTGLDLLAFLPASVQHTGLDIQETIFQDRLEQLRFKILIAEDLTSATNEALKETILDPIQVDVEKWSYLKEFWKTRLLTDILSNNVTEWKRNYVASLISRIEFRQRQIQGQIIRQLSDTNTIYADELIKRKYVVLSGFLLGLIIPLLAYFAPLIFAQMNKGGGAN
jgi:hypothetical protein